MGGHESFNLLVGYGLWSEVGAALKLNQPAFPHKFHSKEIIISYQIFESLY